jgi:hypothetical protein
VGSLRFLGYKIVVVRLIAIIVGALAVSGFCIGLIGLIAVGSRAHNLRIFFGALAALSMASIGFLAILHWTSYHLGVKY